MPKLSEAQKLVYDQLLEGLNRSEIADKLYLSVHTVKDHIREIYMRKNVCNLNQLYAKAIREIKKYGDVRDD